MDYYWKLFLADIGLWLIVTCIDVVIRYEIESKSGINIGKKGGQFKAMKQPEVSFWAFTSIITGIVGNLCMLAVPVLFILAVFC